MSKVDVYLSHLSGESRRLGNIVVAETENRLLQLKIADHESNIAYNKSLLVEAPDDAKRSINLRITEVELFIIELQTKIKMNELLITRNQFHK